MSDVELGYSGIADLGPRLADRSLSPLELCRALEAKSAVALAYAKEAVNLGLQGPHRMNLESEARLFALLFGTEDQKEGMAAFAEKRPPDFRGR